MGIAKSTDDESCVFLYIIYFSDTKSEVCSQTNPVQLPPLCRPKYALLYK